MVLILTHLNSESNIGSLLIDQSQLYLVNSPVDQEFLFGHCFGYRCPKNQLD